MQIEKPLTMINIIENVQLNKKRENAIKSVKYVFVVTGIGGWTSRLGSLISR